MGINSDFLSEFKRKFLASVALLSLIVIMGSPSESRAQTATIGFTYNDYYDSGTGSFSIPISSNSNIGLSDLSAYQFTLNSTFFGGGSSLSYGLSDLSGFSLNFAAPSPPVSNILSLQSNPVIGGNSYVSFSINNGIATIQDYATGDAISGGSVTLDQKSLTQALITNSVNVSRNGTSISAKFTPNFGVSLQQAANIAGFVGFNWVQKVVSLPDPSPFYAVNYSSIFNPIHLTSNSVQFNDPYQGGYTYNPLWNSYPYVYSTSILSSLFPWALSNQETNNTLNFFDAPGDPCLFGGSGKGCNGATSSDPNNQIVFNTYLVGMLPGDVVGPSLFEFTWESNFNGTNLGAASFGTLFPVDVGSGYGGVTILSEKYLLSSSVPEIPTWVMFLAGFSVAAIIKRRSPIVT